MPVVTEAREVRAVYAEADKRNVCLGAFCFEDAATLEGVLRAVWLKGELMRVPSLPVVVAVTSRYPPRPSMRLYTASGDERLGLRMALSDIEALVGGYSPYRNLRVLPHLDHAFPWLDQDGLYELADRFATVMYDASERPLDENITMTRAYVKKLSGRVVVEGCVDEVCEAGAGEPRNEPVSPEQAERYVRETGVDLVVANLGTEHRAAAQNRRFDAPRAREIASRIGRMLVLHGTSSLREEDLSLLWSSGIARVNIYTALATAGGQAEAQWVLDNIGNILREESLAEAVRAGWLGSAYLSDEYAGRCGGRLGPKLEYVARVGRTNAWTQAVQRTADRFLSLLGYDRFAAESPDTRGVGSGAGQ